MTRRDSTAARDVVCALQYSEPINNMNSDNISSEPIFVHQK